MPGDLQHSCKVNGNVQTARWVTNWAIWTQHNPRVSLRVIAMISKGCFWQISNTLIKFVFRAFLYLNLSTVHVILNCYWEHTSKFTWNEFDNWCNFTVLFNSKKYIFVYFMSQVWIIKSTESTNICYVSDRVACIIKMNVKETFMGNDSSRKCLCFEWTAVRE